MKAIAAFVRRGGNPLELLYTGLFFLTLIALFYDTGSRLHAIFMTEPGFGIHRWGFALFTYAGCVAALAHQFRAYRDLGHIGSRSDKLSGRLSGWVDTDGELLLRTLAVLLMVVAVAQVPVITSILDSRFETAFALVGLAVALVLLSWSIGAYLTCSGSSSLELLVWIITDISAVLFWFVFLLFIRFRVVALPWAMLGLLFPLVLLIRYVHAAVDSRRRLSQSPGDAGPHLPTGGVSAEASANDPTKSDTFNSSTGTGVLDT